MNKTGGYVAGFLLSPSKWAPAEDRSKTEPQAATDLVYTTLEATAALTGTAEAEANRRTGDLSIYLYYSKAIGVVPSVLFIVMLALFVFCFSFPSKHGPMSTRCTLLTHTA